MKSIALVCCLIALCAFACGGGKKASTAKEQEFTLGLVQKSIKVGMAQAEVAEALGSPNIVTKDSDGKETWVYDKIASQVSSGGHSGYWTLILIGGTWGKDTTTSSQKTLTVVIKFDDAGRVHKLAYHASKF